MTTTNDRFSFSPGPNQGLAIAPLLAATCLWAFAAPISAIAGSPPRGTDGGLVLVAGETYIFESSSWGFKDPNDAPPNGFNRVLVESLPSLGTLSLNGLPIQAGSYVPIAPSKLAGQYWIPHALDAHDWTAVASSADGTHLVACSNPGRIHTSDDSGANWTARDAVRTWKSVASSADGIRLAACTDDVSPGVGLIYTSSDAGATWTPRDPSGHWTSIASSADGLRLLAGTFPGQLYLSTDAGATWTARESIRYWTSVATSSDGTKLVACADDDAIYTSADAGSTWTPRASADAWSSVASSADGTKLVACANPGRIHTSRDSGITWSSGGTLQPHLWRSVTSSADGTKLAACADADTIYTLDTLGDSSGTWRPRDSQRHWRSIAAAADGINLVACEAGENIYTSTKAPPKLVYTAPGFVFPTVHDPFSFRVEDDGKPASNALATTSNTFDFTLWPSLFFPGQASFVSGGVSILNYPRPGTPEDPGDNLTVVIRPASAAASATWATGPYTNRKSGESLSLDAPSTNTITFSALPDFPRPRDLKIVVPADKSVTATVYYAPPVLKLTLPAADGTMQLTVDGLGEDAYRLEYNPDERNPTGWVTVLESAANHDGPTFTLLTLKNGVSDPGYYRLVIP